MSRWQVQIEGAPSGTDALRFWFPDGNIYAAELEGKSFLVGPGLECLVEASEVYATAKQVLEEFCAAIHLIEPLIDKPRVGVVFEALEDGSKTGYAFVSGTATFGLRARANLSVEGLVLEAPRTTQAQKILEVMRTDRRVKVAASVLAMPGATWPHLYRCLEEVEYILGKKASNAGLCSDNERERFTRTANSAEVAGDAARHRLAKFDPPEQPMTLAQAQIFLRNTLLQAIALIPTSSSTA